MHPASTGKSCLSPPATISVAKAASSSPNSRLLRSIAIGPNDRLIGSAARSTSQSTTLLAAIVARIMAAWSISPDRLIATITAPIAPGPASRGIASGTTATRPFRSSEPPASRKPDVSAWTRSITRAMRKSTIPPPTRNAPRLVPKMRSSVSPVSAATTSAASTVVLVRRAARWRSAVE